MFSNNEIQFDRLKPGDILKYTEQGQPEVQEYLVDDLIPLMFYGLNNVPDDFNVEVFLMEYEFIYDESRQLILAIFRNGRIRVRKYFYLAPVYVAFNLRNLSCLSWEPQHLRYYQKFQPMSYLRQAPEEEAYMLSENPFQVLYHPHIDANAQACYGRWAGNLEGCNDAYQVMETLRAFLSDYNGRSTFFSVDPYAHDRTGSRFPYQTRNQLVAGRVDTPKRFFIQMEKFRGENWLVDFCEYTEGNYTIYSEIINWFMFTNRIPNRDLDEDDYSIKAMFNVFVDKLLHKELGIVKPIKPDYRMDMSDSEREKIDTDWNEYCDLTRRYFPDNVSTDICKWVQNSSQWVLSHGDVEVLNRGFQAWHLANYFYRDDKKYIYDMVTSRQGNKYSINTIMSRYGYDDMNRPAYSSYFMVSLLVNKVPLDVLMETTLEWEYATKASHDGSVYTSLYRTTRKASSAQYDALEAHSMLTGQMSFEGSLFKAHNQTYDFKNVLPEEYYLNTLIHKLSQCMKKLRSGSPELNITHLNKYWEIVEQGDVLVMQNTNFIDLFGSSSVTEEECFVQAMQCLMVDFYVYDIGHMQEWFYDKFEELDTDIQECTVSKQTLLTYFRGGLYDINNLERRAEASAIALTMFYKMFPNFPTKVEDLEKLRFSNDRKVIHNALSYFIEETAKQVKEYRDVLTNTLPSVEQSELFPETIPVN